MQLCKVVNNTTGKSRYYVDGVRVSRDKFEFMEILHKRWDSLCTVIGKDFTRHYKHVSHWSK